MKKITFALLFLLMASPATAADANGNFYIHGMPSYWNAELCKDFSRAQDNNEILSEHGSQSSRYSGYVDWIVGYLVAYNQLMPDTYDILGGGVWLEALWWMQNHCRENPDKQFIEAMASLIEQFRPNRLKEKP